MSIRQNNEPKTLSLWAAFLFTSVVKVRDSQNGATALERIPVVFVTIRADAVTQVATARDSSGFILTAGNAAGALIRTAEARAFALEPVAEGGVTNGHLRPGPVKRVAVRAGEGGMAAVLTRRFIAATH